MHTGPCNVLRGRCRYSSVSGRYARLIPELQKCKLDCRDVSCLCYSVHSQLHTLQAWASSPGLTRSETFQWREAQARDFLRTIATLTDAGVGFAGSEEVWGYVT
jgi:hypothetical protein